MKNRNNPIQVIDTASIATQLEATLNTANALKEKAHHLKQEFQATITTEYKKQGFISTNHLEQWQAKVNEIRQQTEQCIEQGRRTTTNINTLIDNQQSIPQWGKVNNDVLALSNHLKDLQSWTHMSSTFIHEEQAKTNKALNKQQVQTATLPSSIKRLQEAGDKLGKAPTDEDVRKMQQKIIADKQLKSNPKPIERQAKLDAIFARMAEFEKILEIAKDRSSQSGGKQKLDSHQLNGLLHEINKSEKEMDALYKNDPKGQSAYKPVFDNYKKQIAHLNNALMSQEPTLPRDNEQSAPRRNRS